MKAYHYFLAVLTSLFLSFGTAHAALPAGLDTALTALQADAVALAALVGPVIIAVLALAIVFKLVKRFGNKI